MRNKLTFIFLLIVQFPNIYGGAFNLNDYLGKTKDDPDSIFYKNFPLNDFIKITI